MNVYRILGDYIGTSEARVLAEQLVAWHDSMVKHLRVSGSSGRACADDCPHEEAAALWAAAQATFGDRAADLAFLRLHGQARRMPGVRPAGTRTEVRA